MSSSNNELIALEPQPLPLVYRFIYCVAIPNMLVWAAVAYYSYRPKFWRELRDYAFYDGPAASPAPLQTVFLAGATLFVLILAACFLLLALVLTIVTACCPWQRWTSSITAGMLAVVVAAIPFGAAWIYYF